MNKYLFNIIFTFLATAARSAVTLYELYPNINTIGIMVVFDAPVPESATTQVFYEEAENGNWSAVKQGLELSRVTALQYSGCIFWTKPNTQYRVRTVMTDSSNVLFDLTDSITTRSEPQAQTPVRTFYVSPNGTGISQNINSPGALEQSLLDTLLAGDKVFLLKGTYYAGELELKTSGTLQQPIVFEGDSGVILDGSIDTAVQWTRVSTDTANRDYNMFYANLGALNTNCVIADGKRLYPYRNLLELSLFQTIRMIDGNGNISGNFDFGLSGFFRDGRSPSGNYFPYAGYNANTYIKFADGSDTTGKSIHVSKQEFCFFANGKSNIQFRNITFSYYGAAKISGHRCALLFEDCDSLLMDNCRFQFCDRGIFFLGNSDDNIVQHSVFHDDMGDWSYLQFKETNEEYGQLNTYYPNFFPFSYRNMEPGRVYFDRNFTGRGNILRYNIFDGGCDGITCPGTPGDSTTCRNFDIYENEFMHGSDDAFEVDGNASNIRIWGNVIHGVGGVSAASPCYGPVYVFRNVFYDLPEIDFSYIYFDVTGYHLYSEPASASPLKLNASYCDIPGVVYFMHNTCDVGVNGRGFYLQQPLAQSSWANVLARNNIFYVESDEHVLWVRGTDKVDLDYDNYFSAQTFTARQDRPNYGIYYNMQEVAQHILGDTNDSTSFIETHGYELNPTTSWRNEAAHDYRLLPSSNMTDKGVYVPGVNDGFSEAAPDLGAFELVVVRDTNSITDLVEVADTISSRDTVEIIQSGITDTLVTTSSSVTCDSQFVRGIVFVETDSVFTDTLFITENLSQTNHLYINCSEEIVDSVFVPNAANGFPNRNDALEISVYPNPNNGNFFIAINNRKFEKTDVRLLELSGRLVFGTQATADVFPIKLSPAVAPGVYFLELKTSEKSLRKKVFVIQ